jgi:transcriptional regulator with XRE-family HTH domain
MEKTLGQQLTALREAKGMTQEELADKSGVSRPRISRLENDEVDAPRRNTLDKLALALGVQPSLLSPDDIQRLRPQAPAPAPTPGLTSGAATVAEAENILLRQMNAKQEEQINDLKQQVARLWKLSGLKLGKIPSSLDAALAALFAAAHQGSDVEVAV